MNPYDNVGTTAAVRQRARPAVPAGHRLPGRRGRARHRGPAHRLSSRRGWSPTRWPLTRATREHPDVRQGSSVRGAIDTALVAAQLAAMRGGAARRASVAPPRGLPEEYTDVVWTPSCWRCPAGSSSTRPCEATPEAVLREIWEDHFLLEPAARRARLKSGRGRLPAHPAGPVGRRAQRPAAAVPPQAQAAHRGPRRSTSRPAAGAGWCCPRATGRRGRTAAGRRAGRLGDDGRAGRAVALADLETESAVDQLDPGRAARQIARRLSVPRPPRDRRPRRGVGELATCRGPAAPTSSTWSARSRRSPATPTRRRPTSSSASGCGSGGRWCWWSTSPGR